MRTSPSIGVSTFASRTSPSTDQSFVKELAKPTQEKLFLKNFPTLQKKYKTQRTTRQKSTRQMTQMDDIRMVVTHDRQGTPAYNTGLAKVAVQCSADTFVVNQTLVLRINICGENRHLRQARKR